MERFAKRHGKQYHIRRRFLRLGLLIFGFLSLAIIVFTFYGQFAGNFVMAVSPESYQRNIILSEDKSFMSPTSRLTVDPIVDALELTYDWLKLEEAMAQDGNFVDSDHKYIAYTFYLKNNGEEAVPVNFIVEITSVQLQVDEAIRLLIIEDDTIYRMYMKPDTVEKEYYTHLDVIPPIYHFINENLVCNEVIQNFRPEEVRKYSIFVWIEGEDPDCVDSIREGRIKMQMTFKIMAGDEE